MCSQRRYVTVFRRSLCPRSSRNGLSLRESFGTSEVNAGPEGVFRGLSHTAPPPRKRRLSQKARRALFVGRPSGVRRLLPALGARADSKRRRESEAADQKQEIV